MIYERPRINMNCDNNQDFPGFQGDDAAAIVRMWNEWYDRRQREAKDYIKLKHKIDIVSAAEQYEV